MHRHLIQVLPDLGQPVLPNTGQPVLADIVLPDPGQTVLPNGQAIRGWQVGWIICTPILDLEALVAEYMEAPLKAMAAEGTRQPVLDFELAGEEILQKISPWLLTRVALPKTPQTLTELEPRHLEALHRHMAARLPGAMEAMRQSWLQFRP